MKMDWQHFCILLLHAFMLAGYCIPVVVAQKMIFGRKLDMNVINTLVTESMESCTTECNNRNNCGSVNYHRLKKLCELNPKTAIEEQHLSIAPGYVFKQKKADHVDLCDNRCEHGMVCVDDKKCEFHDCKDLYVDNGIAKGNVKSIGSKAIVNCNTGYQIEQRLSEAECGQLGKWTYGNQLTCKKVCAAPRYIEGGAFLEADIHTPSGINYYTGSKIADMLNETILDGSSVRYTCNEDLQMYGLAQSTCEDGKWSTPPVCFYRHCRLETDDFCPEVSLSCSNITCHCEKEIGNFSMKLCVESCTDKANSNLDTNSTTDEAELDIILEEESVYISPNRCEQICRRAKDFACESLKPRRFNFVPDSFDQFTCVLVSTSFGDVLTEKKWWDESGCQYRSKLFG